MPHSKIRSNMVTFKRGMKEVHLTSFLNLAPASDPAVSIKDVPLGSQNGEIPIEANLSVQLYEGDVISSTGGNVKGVTDELEYCVEGLLSREIGQSARAYPHSHLPQWNPEQICEKLDVLQHFYF